MTVVINTHHKPHRRIQRDDGGTARAYQRKRYAYYRQDTDVAGDVMKVGQLNAMPEIKHCAVQNISVGGVGFQADTVYSIGDRLLLRSRILAGGGEIALFCTVRRIVQRRPGVYEYGCSFDMLDPYAEDQIAKAIMDMQMKRRRR